MNAKRKHDRLTTPWDPRMGEVCMTESGLESVVCFISLPGSHGHRNIITRPRLRCIDERGKVDG